MSKQKEYDTPFFKFEWKDPSGVVRPWTDFRHCDKYRDYIEKHGTLKGAHVLDIGGGDGQHAFYLHKYAKKWYVYDLSQAMLKRGRANRKELGFKNEIESNKIEFHQGDMTEIKWNKKKFDIVLFINSLHFTNNPKLAFEEAHRVMNEGGLLLVQEPQDNFLPGSRLNKGTPDFDEESYKKKFAKLSRTENYLNNQKLFTLVERIKDSKKNINFWIFKK